MLLWAYLPYTLPLILAGVVALALSFYASRHRTVRGAYAFMWFCVAALEWCLTYALEINSTDLSSKLFWARIEYLGIAFGPLFWLAFAVHYTRRDRWLTPKIWVPLSIIPFATVLFVFTNEAHGVVWRHVALGTDGPFPTLHIQYGWWFWVHTAFSYLCVLAGSYLLLSGLSNSRHFYRRQRIALIASIIFPWVGNILYIAKLGPVPDLDITPFASTATAVAVALALFSFRVPDLVPVARRAMLDSMNDAVIALDNQDRILDLNRAATTLLGMPHGAIGLTASQVLGRHMDLVEQFAGVREAHTEIVRETSAGTRYFELEISPLRDVVGEYSGRLITLHDITERKRAQKEIETLNVELESRVLARTGELAAANQEKEETLRREQAARQDLAFLAEASRILASSLDADTALTNLANHIVPYLADGCAIHVVDEAGLLRRRAARHIDPAKSRLLAGIEARYLGKYPAPYAFPQVASSGEAAFHPDVRDADLEDAAGDAEHLAALRAVGVSSYMCLPLVGREQMLGAITLLRTEPGREYNAISLALAMDLAQRVALAVDNVQLYMAAQRAVQARDEFLTVASHELRTPLTSLLLALHSLLRGTRQGVLPPADYLARRLGTVQEQGKRLDRLVNDLLDISRITSGHLQLEPQATDLADLVRHTVEQFREELAAARCPIDLQLDGSVPGYWDPTRIEQVITNLLTNAMKYGNGRPVTIAVSAGDSMARLVVTDQGIGISPEYLERVFDRFERAVAPGKYSGMGMGLYISRQIVEAHGGTISVVSAPSKGATFTVELPMGRTNGRAPLPGVATP